MTLLDDWSPARFRRPCLSHAYTVSTGAGIIYQDLYHILQADGIEREGKSEKERDREPRPEEANRLPNPKGGGALSPP